MYRKLTFVLVVLLTLAVMPTQAQDSEKITVEAEALSFVYDSAIAAEVEVTQVEAVPFSDDMPLFAASPEHWEISFKGYADGSEFFHQPRVLIYPTANFADFSIGDEYGDYGYLPMAEALTELLEAEPELGDEYVFTPFEGDDLPMLPIFNAAQILRARVDYLEFEDGIGIRFLSYYAQGPSPILNTEVFYTFQGLTEDGNYYIAAILPVNPGILPDEIDPDTFDWDTFYAELDQYMLDTNEALNDLAPDDFAPSLELLDEMIASITIEAE